jgi:hypothetical protein
VGARSLFILALLACAMLSFASAIPRAASAVPPSIEMGYSPGSLSPISSGVPVYATGDSVWVMSGYQSAVTLQLSNPNGNLVSSYLLEPEAAIMLLTFSSSSPVGSWVVSVSGSGSQVQTQVASVSFLLVGDVQLPTNMTTYAFSGPGALSTSFTTADSDAYNFLACGIGDPTPGTVSIPLPSSLGSGDLLLTLNGSLVQLAMPGAQVTTPFDFWAELHQDYSYSAGTNSTVVSRDLEVAGSATVPISGANGTSSPLNTFMHMRPGRFTIRAFFDSSLGLSVAQAPVLITDNNTSWISLQNCSGSSTFSGSTFTLSSNLESGTQLWPRDVYLMYMIDGVEMYSMTPLTVEPAAVDVVASPWGTGLTDSALALHSGPDVLVSQTVGDLMFVVANQYPVDLQISLPPGVNETVEIPTAYSYISIQVNSTKLVVDTALGGKPASGAVLTVYSDNMTIDRVVSGDEGASVFYLLPGSYNITATLDNTSRTNLFTARAGNSSVVSIDFPVSTASGTEYTYLLWATAVVGLLGSAAVWVKIYTGRLPSRKN